MAFGLCTPWALAEEKKPAPPPKDVPVLHGEEEPAPAPPRAEGKPGVPEHPPQPPGQPRGQRPGERQHPPGFWRRMPPQERARLEAFVEEHFPRLYLELERHKDRKHKDMPRRIRRIMPEMLRLMEAMETHPELGTLMIQERRIDMDLHRLVRQYRTCEKEEKRARLRKQVHERCARAFDIRHQRREIEIRGLEVRIEELKQRHAQAAEMRKKLIEREVKTRLDRPVPPPAEPREEL
jgi:hypothetical protein